jgi:hypothetical protein
MAGRANRHRIIEVIAAAGAPQFAIQQMMNLQPARRTTPNTSMPVALQGRSIEGVAL